MKSYLIISCFVAGFLLSCVNTDIIGEDVVLAEDTTTEGATEAAIKSEEGSNGPWEADTPTRQHNIFSRIKLYLSDWRSMIYLTSSQSEEESSWAEPEQSENLLQEPGEMPEAYNATLSNSAANENVTGTSNETVPATINKYTRMFQCQPRNLSEPNEVKIVNSSVFQTPIIVEPNKTVNYCSVVMFYAPWCPYSATAAPHYNALARSFPDISFLAVNAMAQGSLNTRYGIVAIPTVVLFHGGRPVSKFNDTSFVLEKFSAYITKYTGLHPGPVPLNLSDEDFEGPLPCVPTRETDYVLCLAWFFILLCASFGFAKSSVCKNVLETIRSNWREAEAQHDHAD